MIPAAVLFGLLHALVDAASLAVLYAEVARQRLAWDEICGLLALYNFVAFGLQLPMGIVLDGLRLYKRAAALGLALTCAAVVVSARDAYLAVVVVGVGNALFHIGAGAIVLQKSEGRATGPGIFVAPGALGVTLGIWLGEAGLPHHWLLALGLAAAALATAWWPMRPAPAAIEPRRRPGRAVLVLCMTLLFVSVSIRSQLGGALAAPWREAWETALAVTLAAVAGKALGGAIADRLGWRVVAVGAMILLAPMVAPAPADMPLAAESVVLLQLTMAVTLAAMFTMLPGHPAAAFGLLSLALLAGSPDFLAVFPHYETAPWLWLMALVSAAALLVGIPRGRQHRSQATGLNSTPFDRST